MRRIDTKTSDTPRPNRLTASRRRLRESQAAVLLLICFGTTIGCGGPTSTTLPQENRNNQPGVARTSSGNEAVQVTTHVTPSPMRLSDEATLTVTIEHETGITLQPPLFGESVGEFLILDFHEPLPRIDGGREILQQIYTLEPTSIGELNVSPVIVRYEDHRPGGAERKGSVQTEGLSITVTSMLESEMPSLADLKPAAGPRELPPPETNVLWWIFTGSAAVVVAWAAIFLAMARRPSESQPVLTPQQLARQELQQVVVQLRSGVDVKQFFVELTGVVRRYIERTTGIHAPEQTTNEFLRAITTHDSFPARESRRLQQFLVAADLIKFAGHQPQQQDIDTSIERARAFIGISWSQEHAA